MVIEMQAFEFCSPILYIASHCGIFNYQEEVGAANPRHKNPNSFAHSDGKIDSLHPALLSGESEERAPPFFLFPSLWRRIINYKQDIIKQVRSYIADDVMALQGERYTQPPL